MSNRLIQYGFTAGIVSKTLWSQTILQKYGWGLADCKNYIVEFSGMLTSRPGLLGGTLLPIDPDAKFRLVPFIFAEEDANTFALIFISERVFFAQQGSLQLEAAKAVTAITNNAAYTQFTCTGHGYSVGDFVEFYGDDVPAALVGQIVEVTAVPDVNTFRVTQFNLAANMDNWEDAATAAVNAYRVYSLTTPYGEDDLEDLYFDQARDQVKILHGSYATRILEREEDGTWTLSNALVEIGQDPPTNLAFIARSSIGGALADFGAVYVVTAINEEGEESIPSNYLIVNSIENATGSWVKVGWDAVDGAVRYNIYRSIMTGAGRVSNGAELGYLGSSFAPVYTDQNLTPDFTKNPPRDINPFGNNSIESVTVETPGSGYAQGDTVEFTGTGSGAVGTLVVDDTGTIIGVLIEAGGSGYSTAGVSITTSGGSGATFTVNTTPASGNFPRTAGLHQQRQLYANTVNEPLKFWGSNIGLFSNYSRSRVLAPDESFEYEIDSKLLGEIKHFISARSGLVTFTNIGIWSVTGSNGGSITATDVEAEPITAIGASDLVPIMIDADVLYGEPRNQVIRLLQYNHYSRQFGGTDVSVLARDLFAKWNRLVSWSFEARPYRVVWSSRNDGQMLSATIAQEQEVYAWARHDTEGEIEQNITLPESDREVTYCVVRRYVGGRFVRYLEYFADREQSTNENHCGVDCAVQFGGGVNPAVKLTLDFDDGISAPSSVEEFVTGTSGSATASSAIFSAADEGKYIRYREGKALIITHESSTRVIIEYIHDFTSLRVPYANRLKPLQSGEWELLTLQDSHQLPLNFRPSTVTVIGDGKVFPDTVVGADGLVTFEEELAFGYIGYGFECCASTLPFTAEGTIIEDSRKDVVGLGIRYVNTKGLELGTALDDLYPIEMLFHDNLSEASLLRDGHEYVLVSSDWDENTQIFMKANGAFPTQITGIVVDLEVGDDVD